MTGEMAGERAGGTAGAVGDPSAEGAAPGAAGGMASGMASGPANAPAPRDRIVTLPNLVSLLRLLLIPVFLWLVLAEHLDLAALGVLVLSGATDYLDGYLARRLRQQSRLGRLLDPVADRLYILAVVIALALRDVIPWWVAVLLPLRDLFLWALVPLLRTRGYTTLPVHFLGKAATFSLLYAFPLLFLGQGEGTGPLLARVFGWSFAVWGIGLYWWAGVLYAWQVRRLLATTPPLRRPRPEAERRPNRRSKRTPDQGARR